MIQEPLEPAAVLLLILVVVYIIFHVRKHNRQYVCQECGFTFELDELNRVCPYCGSDDIKPTLFPGPNLNVGWFDR